VAEGDLGELLNGGIEALPQLLRAAAAGVGAKLVGRLAGVGVGLPVIACLLRFAAGTGA
jgi:hypothetical protein